MAVKKFHHLFFFLTLFVSSIAFGQEVTVLDYRDIPIEDVIVSSADGKHQEFTNADGKADLSAFNKNVDLVFQHLNYNDKTISFEKLASSNYLINLKVNKELLEEVVVSTNVNDEYLKNRAERRILLDQKKMERLHFASTPELLRNVTGVNVQQSQMGGGSPVIRGFEANRVLLVVDGVRLNNAIFRSGHLQNSMTIDPAVLQSTEIIFGPSSVLYGSDALGGTVHFRTRTPKVNTKGIKSHFYSKYFSANKGIVNHIDVEFSKKKFAFLTSATKTSFGDLRMGTVRPHGYSDWGKVFDYADEGTQTNNNSNIQRNTGYDQIDLLQKVVFRPNEDFRLIGNFQYSSSSDIPRFDQLNDYKDDELKFERWDYGPQKRFLASLTAEIDKESKWYDRGEIIAAYQNFDESRHKLKMGDTLTNNKMENVKVYSLNANFRKNNLSYGLELTHNKVISRANDTGESGTVYPTNITRYAAGGTDMQSYALYSRYRHSFSDKLKASAGIRYTHSKLFAEFIFDDPRDFKLVFDQINNQHNSVNGNITLVYNPNEFWKIAAIYSTGFHTPNIDDVGKYFTKGNNLILPNDQLKTEFVRNSEISITKNFNNKALFNADVFYTRLVNAVIKADVAPPFGSVIPEGFNPQTNVNVPDAEVYGVNSSFTIKLNRRLKVKSGITFTRGQILSDFFFVDRDDENGDPVKEVPVENKNLAHIPPVFGHTSIDLDLKNAGFSFYSFYNGTKNAADYDAAGVDNFDEATEDGTPSWYTLNMSVYYKFNKHIELQVALENFLDHHYKAFGSGISAPGRNLIIGVHAKF